MSARLCELAPGTLDSSRNPADVFLANAVHGSKCTYAYPVGYTNTLCKNACEEMHK